MINLLFIVCKKEKMESSSILLLFSNFCLRGFDTNHNCAARASAGDSVRERAFMQTGGVGQHNSVDFENLLTFAYLICF